MAKDFSKKRHKISLFWLFYDHCRWILFPFFMLIFRPKIRYINKNKTKKFLKHNGALIIANHISFMDPLMLQFTFLYRRIHTMTLSCNFSNRLNRFFFTRMNCFPIDPNKLDMSAARETLKRLNNDYLVALFPEGHINFKNKEVQPFKSGISLFALQAKKDVVPIFYYRQKKHSRFEVLIGEPVDLSFYYKNRITKEVINEVTLLLYQKEKELEKSFFERKS